MYLEGHANGHIVNNIKHVHNMHEAFIKQDDTNGKSNKVNIHGNSNNHPDTENMIRQDGSNGKSNKVSLHKDVDNHNDELEHRLDLLNASVGALALQVEHLIDVHVRAEKVHRNKTEQIPSKLCCAY